MEQAKILIFEKDVQTSGWLGGAVVAAQIGAGR